LARGDGERRDGGAGDEDFAERIRGHGIGVPFWYGYKNGTVH
jgi:hypothetical protein